MTPVELASYDGLFAYLATANRKVDQPQSTQGKFIMRNLAQTPTSSDSDRSALEVSQTALASNTERRIVRFTGNRTSTTTITPKTKTSAPRLEGQGHTFTFTIMLDKIYAATVRDIIRDSRRRFKPLPKELTPRETRVLVVAKRNRDDHEELPPNDSKDSSLLAARGIATKARGSYAARAFKKRCVGRSWSVDGRPTDEEGRVHDTATSNIDQDCNPEPDRLPEESRVRLVTPGLEMQPVLRLFQSGDVLAEAPRADKCFFNYLDRIGIYKRHTTIADDLICNCDAKYSANKSDGAHRPQDMTRGIDETLLPDVGGSEFFSCTYLM